MRFELQLLCFCSVLVLVASHGMLSKPISRGVYANSDTQMEIDPIQQFDSPDFICRNNPVSPRDTWIDLTAGQKLDINWYLPAPHPGDCFIYMTYDADKPDDKKKWFKLANWSNCDEIENLNNSMIIPSYLPSSDHVILRWEWYAIHLKVINVIQYYCSCFDATITGSTQGQLPGPKVHIPGHLPQNSSFYRDEDKSTPFWFTGPPIATLEGAIEDDDHEEITTSSSSQLKCLVVLISAFILFL